MRNIMNFLTDFVELITYFVAGLVALILLGCLVYGLMRTKSLRELCVESIIYNAKHVNGRSPTPDELEQCTKFEN